MSKSTLIALGIVGLLCAGPARAIDQPIAGLKIRLVRGTSGKQRLVFVSKDPALLFPSVGSADAPTVAGLSVDLFSPAEPSGAISTAPAGGVQPGWKITSGAYRFGRSGPSTAITPVRRVVLQQGKQIAVTVDATGLALNGPQGGVGIRIRTGSLRSCARFDGTAIVTDRAGRFVGRNSTTVGLTDCSDHVLAGFAPVCGDGEKNGAETCDTYDAATCSAAGVGAVCGPAGTPLACQCCAYDEAIALSASACCDPAAKFVVNPPSPYGRCVTSRCDFPPPLDHCNSGDTCQADGSCCTSLGSECAYSNPVTGGGFLNPCCPGTTCTKGGQVIPGGGFTLVCCVPNAGTCTSDADCCTNHCDVGACTP